MMHAYFRLRGILVFSFCMQLIGLAIGTSRGQETLPALPTRNVPTTHRQLWNGYDPRSEPLDIEILKEWKQDGVVLRVVRFRVGTFKGQTATLAAVYGFPEGGSKLPGLVQIHGGGQYADYKAPLNNARRGYATISIAWAGRISAPDYLVNPEVVKLFWDNATDHPKYRLTTDWGSLDAYHAPSKHGKDAFVSIPVEPWTLDAVQSPRNNSWFLCTLAARRAITFLERQPEVDADRLGVYGHSMGGKLTVATAGSDARIKAAVPSCGGVSDRTNRLKLFRETLGDPPSLKGIDCPILFQMPSNDFHGRIDDLQIALDEIKSSQWRISCSPHHNHQDTSQYIITSQLWFDQHLKGTFEFPQTPVLSFEPVKSTGKPTVRVRVDSAMPVSGVEIYFTRQGQMDGKKDMMDNTKSRFWHFAKPIQRDGDWYAELSVDDSRRPLWVYANVNYEMKEPVTAAGYYYRAHTSREFTLSSRMLTLDVDAVEKIPRTAAKRERLIESFQGDWEKEWFDYQNRDWSKSTHKVYEDKWHAPENARLAFEIRSSTPNKMVVGIDQYAVEVEVKGEDQWQTVDLSVADFRDASGLQLANWKGIKELRLGASQTLRQRERGAKKSVVKLGGVWKGKAPDFRNLRWVRSTRDN